MLMHQSAGANGYYYKKGNPLPEEDASQLSVNSFPGEMQDYLF